jgi:hypothetical protein
MILIYNKAPNKDHQVGYQATPNDLIEEFGRETIIPFLCTYS